MKFVSGDSGGTDAAAPGALRLAMLVLVVAIPIVCWGPHLFWGLQLDETFTAWQAEGGLGLFRTKLENPGQSVLFGYIEALFYRPGSPHMEAWLRVPAAVGAILSGLLVHRLAVSFVGKRAGMLALLPFFANPDLIRFATEARPYTLATTACLASLLGLRRWLEGGRRRDLALFSVALAIVFYLHFMYVGFLVVPTVWVALEARRRPIDWRSLGAGLVATVVLCLPLVPLARDLRARGGGLQFTHLPTWRDLLDAWLPWTVLLASLGWLVVAVRFRATLRERRPDRGLLALLLAWFLVPGLFLFAVSHLRHQAVLIDRYLLPTVVAQALFVATLYDGLPPVLARVALIACVAPLPLIFGARDWTRADGVNSWRAPFAAVRAIDPEARAPLFVQAGHPLSNQLDWERAAREGSYHYSPLTVYPVPNRIYPLPTTVDAKVTAFVRAAAEGELARAPLILWVGESRYPMVDWFRAFFEARGYVGTYAFRDGLCLLALRLRAPS